MELSDDLETLYKQLALKKYKGTLTEEEVLIFADLTEQRNRIDTSSAGLGSTPSPLVNFVSDLGGFGDTMDDMARKIRSKESHLDLAQRKPDEK